MLLTVVALFFLLSSCLCAQEERLLALPPAFYLNLVFAGVCVDLKVSSWEMLFTVFAFRLDYALRFTCPHVCSCA